MDEALFTLSTPANEPVLPHAPGSPERRALKAKLDELASTEIEIPLIIGGQEVRTGRTAMCVMPHDHRHVLAVYHQAGPAEVQMAIDAAHAAWHEWPKLPWPERVSIFLKAAEMLAGPRRAEFNAATMLGIGKNVCQSEIDAICELADFFRFNAHFVDGIYSHQPESSLGVWDRLEWRPLEGFVFAASPFNFTSIAGNLCSAPAMMGNTIIWKPASSAVYPAYAIMRLLVDAGLPPGVINFLPGPGAAVGNPLVAHRDLAGIHFTGSTGTFQRMWSAVGQNITGYRSYPRIVGETGGKDFVFVHVEAPDEMGHEGNVEGKVKAIEDFDEKVVGTVLKGIGRFGDYRVLVLSDHPTPIAKKTHTSEPSPFAVLCSRQAENVTGAAGYTEEAARQGRIVVSPGFRLMEGFIGDWRRFIEDRRR